jgi:hypothetical protein
MSVVERKNKRMHQKENHREKKNNRGIDCAASDGRANVLPMFLFSRCVSEKFSNPKEIRMKIVQQNWIKLVATACVSCALLLFLTTWVWADEIPAPVLRIEALGTNRYSISITNGVTNGAYVLYWAPSLSAVDNSSWIPFEPSVTLGETNWLLDGGEVQNAWFRVILGIDWDNDGIFNWADADPLDAGLGALDLMIDFPLTGTVLQ